MFAGRNVILLLSCIVLTGCTQAGREYEKQVRSLAFGTPPELIKSALEVLRGAGPAAFPTLIAHFGDRGRADEMFQLDTTGSPTVGELCFDIIQDQIEGPWPKGFRDYYVLTPKTTQEWLNSHKGLSLRQLRIAAAEESLRRAETESVPDSQADFHHEVVQFLRRNLQEAKQRDD